nr:hypothetical protein [uncultured Desulfobacter sp.]
MDVIISPKSREAIEDIGRIWYRRYVDIVTKIQTYCIDMPDDEIIKAFEGRWNGFETPAEQLIFIREAKKGGCIKTAVRSAAVKAKTLDPPYIGPAIIYMTYFKEKALKIIEKVTSRIINYLIAGAILLCTRLRFENINQRKSPYF